VLDLLNWSETNGLTLTPKFQRRNVWKPAARSYLIDSMLRGFPVPPIHVRMLGRGAGSQVTREVIDGQQRLRSVFDYIKGKYRLSPSLPADWAGKAFEELSPEQAAAISEYSFHTYLYTGIDDPTVLEIFARFNTNAMSANAQELRNGKYFGAFKQSVYACSLNHLEFWRSSKILTEDNIVRMREAELTSELLVLQMDGLQDKKNSLDMFYEQLDSAWPRSPTWTVNGKSFPAQPLSRKTSEDRLDATLSAIGESVGDVLPNSRFTRVPLFYSLYGAVYHRLFGVPRYARKTPVRPLSAASQRRLRESVESLSDLLADKAAINSLSGWQAQFVQAAALQTDNVGPRKTRLDTIWEQAKLGQS
jgi:hypothetical protein